MNRKRRFYALLCLCAALLVCMPTAEAASVLSPTFLSVDGADLGAGDLGEQKEPESSSQQDTSSSSSAADGKTQQQQQLTDLNQQIKDLKDQQAQIQDKIDAAKNEKEQAKLEKDNIDSQIYNTQEQIQLTNQKIALLKDNIAKANQDAQALEVDIDVQYEQFKSQIRNSYMSPSYSFLEYLFGSESFADFSVRMETVARISAYDQKVIDDLEHEIRELELTQASLEADMQSLQQSNEELEALQGQLSVQSQEAQEYIEDINAMEKEFLADKEEMQALQKQIQAEITQIYASLNASSSTNSEYLGDGTWAWPVPGYTYISSPYGWRFSGSDFHTGMDIAGYGRSIYGAPIVACGDGTVVKVQNNGGSGYGLFCIIDHGGGYTTLYAHTSSIIVAVGEEVEKGDIIGYVGNSGWVIPSPTPGNPTGGSHLHVEFRIDGMHYDPAQFLY